MPKTINIAVPIDAPKKTLKNLGSHNLKYRIAMLVCVVLASLIMLAKIGGISVLIDEYAGIAVLVLAFTIVVIALAEPRNR